MFRRFSTDFAIFSIILDIIITSTVCYVADAVRLKLSFLTFLKPVPADMHIPWVLYLVFPIIWVGIFSLLSVYDGRKNFRVVDEVSSLSLGSLVAMISMAGILYLSYRNVSRFMFLSFVGITYLVMLGWRLIYRLFLRFTSKQQSAKKRNVLVIGVSPSGVQLMEQVRKNTPLGLEFVGFLDDDPGKREMISKVIGPIGSVRQIIKAKDVNDVVLALPQSEYAQINEVVSELHDLPVKVWVIPDYYSLTMHRAVVEEFAGITMLDLRAPALSEYQRMIKRGFDLLFSVAIMPFILPLMGIISICIRLEGPGGALFRQLRVGENGKLFWMIKFRTMVPGADQLRHSLEKVNEKGEMVYKFRDDPRVTRVGKFLRKTSLDEIPQVFNVFRGEMSWVGPRPELPELVDAYDYWQRKRFTVPQGITGWWQIKGRSDRPMHLHTEDDIYYVQHYSIWLDIQILFLTFWTALRGKGAF